MIKQSVIIISLPVCVTLCYDKTVSDIKQSVIIISLPVCVTLCYDKTVSDNNISASVCDSVL